MNLLYELRTIGDVDLSLSRSGNLLTSYVVDSVCVLRSRLSYRYALYRSLTSSDVVDYEVVEPAAAVCVVVVRGEDELSRSNVLQSTVSVVAVPLELTVVQYIVLAP